jgi:ubiquinone/menaquinone biosynthesis C-methylase UbiE
MAKVEPFDIHTDDYDSWFEKNRYAYLSELQAVREQLPSQGDRVEIGVGTGRFAVPLGIDFGVEPSRNMCLIAKSRGVLTARAVGEALPFRDAEFNAALMMTTICFLDSVTMALAEAFRVLKPGGCLVIGFIDRASPLGQLYQRHRNKSRFYRVATFYTAVEIERLMQQAGFRDITFVQTIFQDPAEIKEIEPVWRGHGSGSFVVAKGTK